MRIPAVRAILLAALLVVPLAFGQMGHVLDAAGPVNQLSA